MSLAEIRSLLGGETGSTITVSVVRPRRAEPQKIVITRDTVTIPAVSDKVMPDNVGYIKVDAFTKGKSQEIANKIKAVQKDGAKRLVLDLRNASDGDESEGIATANLFLNHERSPICKVRNTHEKPSTLIRPRQSQTCRSSCW
jgi:carboxyl-terminal processing protease